MKKFCTHSYPVDSLTRIIKLYLLEFQKTILEVKYNP